MTDIDNIPDVSIGQLKKRLNNIDEDEDIDDKIADVDHVIKSGDYDEFITMKSTSPLKRSTSTKTSRSKNKSNVIKSIPWIDETQVDKKEEDGVASDNPDDSHDEFFDNIMTDDNSKDDSSVDTVHDVNPNPILNNIDTKLTDLIENDKTFNVRSIGIKKKIKELESQMRIMNQKLDIIIGALGIPLTKSSDKKYSEVYNEENPTPDDFDVDDPIHDQEYFTATAIDDLQLGL